MSHNEDGKLGGWPGCGAKGVAAHGGTWWCPPGEHKALQGWVSGSVSLGSFPCGGTGWQCASTGDIRVEVDTKGTSTSLGCRSAGPTENVAQPRDGGQQGGDSCLHVTSRTWDI